MRRTAQSWLLVACATIALPAVAQLGALPQVSDANTPVLAAPTADVLNRAIDALNRQKFDEASAALATLDRSHLSPYEQSRVEQIGFNIAFALKQVDDSRAHLRAAIAAGGLNPREIEQARYQIAQTYLAEQRWQEGGVALEQWFASVQSPDSAAYYLLAVAYYQMGDFDRAIAPAERAIALTESPREPWVRLLLAVRLQRKEYQDAARLLQRLVVMAPAKKTYWMQLSSVYGQLGDYPSALATLQSAYDAGLLTDEADIRRYENLRAYTAVP